MQDTIDTMGIPPRFQQVAEHIRGLKQFAITLTSELQDS
jgi:hypothetical protein